MKRGVINMISFTLIMYFEVSQPDDNKVFLSSRCLNWLQSDFI